MESSSATLFAEPLPTENWQNKSFCLFPSREAGREPSGKLVELTKNSIINHLEVHGIRHKRFCFSKGNHGLSLELL